MFVLVCEWPVLCMNDENIIILTQFILIFQPVEDQKLSQFSYRRAKTEISKIARKFSSKFDKLFIHFVVVFECFAQQLTGSSGSINQ